jgi:hypothetical protein
MMLTELYYYYANPPTVKAPGGVAFDFFPTSAKAVCTAGVITTFNNVHDHETAHDLEWLLDSRSRDGIAGKSRTKRDGPRLLNAKPPPTRPRRCPMVELTEHRGFLPIASKRFNPNFAPFFRIFTAKNSTCNNFGFCATSVWNGPFRADRQKTPLSGTG